MFLMKEYSGNVYIAESSHVIAIIKVLVFNLGADDNEKVKELKQLLGEASQLLMEQLSEQDLNSLGLREVLHCIEVVSLCRNDKKLRFDVMTRLFKE